MNHKLTCLTTCLLLGACASKVPVAPVALPTPPVVVESVAVAPPVIFVAVAPPAAPVPTGKVSHATDPKAYRVDGARHLYTAYPDRIYKGKLPPLVHAVVITEVELDAAGHVRDIKMVRVPSHAPEVVVKVREMIRAASPLPAPQRMGGTRYTDIWLVDKSGRWQLDTLTEGQL